MAKAPDESGAFSAGSLADWELRSDRNHYAEVVPQKQGANFSVADLRSALSEKNFTNLIGLSLTVAACMQ